VSRPTSLTDFPFSLPSQSPRQKADEYSRFNIAQRLVQLAVATRKPDMIALTQITTVEILDDRWEKSPIAMRAKMTKRGPVIGIGTQFQKSDHLDYLLEIGLHCLLDEAAKDPNHRLKKDWRTIHAGFLEHGITHPNADNIPDHILDCQPGIKSRKLVVG
jgi:hypothetical protein